MRPQRLIDKGAHFGAIAWLEGFFPGAPVLTFVRKRYGVERNWRKPLQCTHFVLIQALGDHYPTEQVGRENWRGDRLMQRILRHQHARGGIVAFQRRAQSRRVRRRLICVRVQHGASRRHQKDQVGIETAAKILQRGANGCGVLRGYGLSETVITRRELRAFLQLPETDFPKPVEHRTGRR